MIVYSDYDSFAQIYNKYWGDFGTRSLTVLQSLILDHIPAGSRLLDLCCGTGQLARELLSLGYLVTGLDGSKEMLEFAKGNAPGAEFMLEDARTFHLAPVYRAVVSTFDSLNHIMSHEELSQVFINVKSSLVPAGVFLFDLNMEEGYKRRWRGSFAIVEENQVCAVRSSYKEHDKIGQMDITIFTHENGWQRTDTRLVQRCYSEKEVKSFLKSAGFEGTQSYDAVDLGMAPPEERGGRICFLARKPSGE